MYSENWLYIGIVKGVGLKGLMMAVVEVDGKGFLATLLGELPFRTFSNNKYSHHPHMNIHEQFFQPACGSEAR